MLVEFTRRLLREARGIINHRLARGAGFLAAGQYIAAGLNFATNLLAARLLGPKEYGLVALTMAYPTLLWSFVGVKSLSVTTRYVAMYRAQGENGRLRAVAGVGYALDFLVSCLTFILVAASAWWIARSFYGHPEVAWIMVVYAGTFPFTSLTGGSWAILQSWERFQQLAIFEIFHPFLKLCLAMGLLALGFGVAGVVVGMGLAGALTGLLMAWTATRLLVKEGIGLWWKASFREVMPLLRELVSLFGWNYLAVTLSGVLGQVPVIMLGRLRGPEEAGWFRLATNLVVVSSYLRSSLGRVAYPVLAARWGKGERKGLMASMIRWTGRAGVPMGLLMLAVIPVLPILVPIVFGPAYAPAVPLAQVMFAGAAVSVVFFWLPSFYYAAGEIRTWTIGYTIYTLAVIGLGWFAIMRWGVIGLAALMVAGEISFTLVMAAVSFSSHSRETVNACMDNKSKRRDLH